MINPVAIPNRSPLSSKYLLIAALIRKEMAVQFGRHELGFAWVFLDPLTNVLVMGFVVGVLLKSKTIPDIPYPFFLLLGFQLLTMFKSAMNGGMDAIGSHRQFMAYRTIGTLDVFLAKFLYNFLINTFATVLFIIAAIWWEVDVSLGQLQTITGAYFSAWLLGCGCGLSLGVVTRNSLMAQKLIKLAQRPLMFLSCVLHPYSEVSPFVAQYMYWNPLVHCIEHARKSLFPYYHVGDLNLFYPWIAVIIMMGIGASVYFKNRHNF